MAEQKIRFASAEGQALAARLELPRTRPTGFALFAHCFTCSKNFKTSIALTRGLVRQGFGVLRFDFTGLGESEGDFADSNFSSNIQDLFAAADWLRENYEAPQLLVGHSFGGAAVLAAAGQLAEVRAVATIGAPAEPSHVKHLFKHAVDDIRNSGELEVQLAGRPFRIRKQFLDDIEQHKQQQAIQRLNKPLLIMHSPVDTVVDIDNARLIYEAARHPKSFIALDHADHFLSNPDDADFATEIMSRWAGRYLTSPTEESTLTLGVVEVKENNLGQFGNSVMASGHALLADEPKSAGGEDTGPNPYDYLLAALGTCTNMTLRLYAQRKGIDLGPLSVHLQHQRIHASDCQDCTHIIDHNAYLDLIERKIKLPTGLDEQSRQKLLEIADKCPVHKTLNNQKHIRTTLMD